MCTTEHSSNHSQALYTANDVTKQRPETSVSEVWQITLFLVDPNHDQSQSGTLVCLFGCSLPYNPQPIIRRNVDIFVFSQCSMPIIIIMIMAYNTFMK